MSAEDDFVKSNLDILQQMQLEGMDYEDYARWQLKINDVKKEYDQARLDEKDASKTKEQRDDAKKRGDAIAKAAPDITKSVIAAVKAFQSGDPINGAAALMDICASLAPLIATFLSAAGPEGALIGAFFSIIGQILRCFGPKQESDVAKLEKFLVNLEARAQLRDIKAVHDDVLTYATTLTVEAGALQSILTKPLKTDTDYRDFYVELRASTIVLGAKDPHSSVSGFKTWEVFEYLQDPDNQDVDLWPAVLGVCCKTYSDLVSSNMTITAMTHSDDLMARLDDLASPDLKMTDAHKHELEKGLLDLVAYGKARMTEYRSVNARTLRALRDVTKVAQGWGFHACIADNHALKFVTGPKKVRSGDWKDVSDGNYYHQVFLVEDPTQTITKGKVSSEYTFKPAHHCYVLKSTSSSYPGSHHWVDHLWVHADTMDVDHVRQVLDRFEPAFSGISASGQDDAGASVFAGTAEGTGKPGSITKFRLGSKDNFNSADLVRENWWPQTKGAVTSISAVTAPVSPAGDPDAAALSAGWGETMIYASMKDANEIYLNVGNQEHYVPGFPGWGACTSVVADQSYLWLVQPYGFAVVSHASVLAHIRGTRPAPRWIGFPSLGDELLGEQLNRGDGLVSGPKYRFSYQGIPVQAKPPLLGLLSLSPCSDGTLLAAVVHRTIVETPVPYQYRKFATTDEWTIRSAPFAVDAEKGTVTVDKWTQIPGRALRVQKLPMPGYTLLSNLMTNLAEKIK